MYAGMTGDRAGSNFAPLADFRSDTVTRPSAGMRAAMADAEVGDDVYDEDPTVHRLEDALVALTGKQAALFFATGTQSNLAALLTHCGRGEEYIAGAEYHIFSNEAAGAAVLGGISPYPLATDESGGLTPEQVTAAVKPDAEQDADPADGRGQAQHRQCAAAGTRRRAAPAPVRRIFPQLRPRPARFSPSQGISAARRDCQGDLWVLAGAAYAFKAPGTLL